MQEKLEAQRRQIELETGIAIGPAQPSYTTSTSQTMSAKRGRGAKSPKQARSSEKITTRSQGRGTEKQKGRSGRRGRDRAEESDERPSTAGEEMSIDTENINSEIDEELEAFFSEEHNNSRIA